MICRWRGALGAVVVSLGMLAGCTGPSDDPVRLRVVASSELADMRPLLADLRKDTGVQLDVDYRGTVDASDAIAEGNHDRFDLAWLSSDHYLELRLRGRKPSAPLPLSTTIMTSPVVVGVTPDIAGKLTAHGPDVTWAQIADLAASGEFRFAMGDPRHSGSGLAALVGVATAAAETGRALRPEDVRCDRLSGFWTGHKGLSDNAADAEREFVASPDGLNGLITYESALLTLNANGKLKQPLRLIYPTDGIVLADYPMLLLNDRQRAAYDKVVAWLRGEETQRRIMNDTSRRPVNPAVGRTDRLTRSIGNALFYPDDINVIVKLQNNFRAPGNTDPTRRYVVFVLDYSGSMRGLRIEALRAAFAELTGASGSSFVRFYQGERFTVLRFAGTVLEQREFTVGSEQDLAALRDMLATEKFGDSTAIWSAVDAGYEAGAKVQAERPGTQVAVVLMTDGLNNAGIGADEFLAGQRRRGPVGPLFPIRFGDADATELSTVAGQTPGGRMIDATTGSSLANAFKETRGCF
ncbi:Ca-activated chloride channel family protein [Actinocrispum wychmicini]|uniref:Ca-activated chloride channel family protein n=2 Tax=Actinocrispum wychmicini TaxID=1213861 RepID=A0A4R2K0I0_9PSEU|nr:Ca-activated chloride channel family protein [Actinocrispum wychmicini]